MKRLDSLTALRFFAAVSIIVEHSRPSFRSMDWIPHFRYDFGVSFFFVLSGFILGFAYHNFEDRRSIRDFYIARVARIWPLHIFTLLAFFLLIPAGRWFLEGSDGYHAWILVANVFLVQAWIPKAAFFFSGNAVAWSISAEMFFYLIFPLLRHQWARTWRLKFCLVLALAAGVAFFATWLGVDRFDPSHPMAYSTVGFGYISPFTQVLLFAMGMLVHTGFQFVKKERWQGGTLAWTVLELIAIALIVVVSHIVGPLGDRTVLETVAPFFCIAPFFGLLILIFGIGRGAVSRMLSFRYFVLLGEASFALYMSHQIFLMVMLEYRPYLKIPDFVLCSIYWISAIFLSVLLWMFVETPARAWVRKSALTVFSSIET